MTPHERTVATLVHTLIRFGVVDRAHSYTVLLLPTAPETPK